MLDEEGILLLLWLIIEAIRLAFSLAMKVFELLQQLLVCRSSKVALIVEQANQSVGAAFD